MISEILGGHTRDPDFLPEPDEDEEEEVSADDDAPGTDANLATSSPAASTSSGDRISSTVADFGLSDFELGTTKRGVTLTSSKGKRRAPTATASTNHPGIDLAAPSGTAVYTPLGGTVSVVRNQGATVGYGFYIDIAHGNNIYTRFGHLKELPDLSAGQTVSAGKQIGKVGSTGDSTGPHLHFEVFEKTFSSGKTVWKKLDPLQWLNDNQDATFPVAVTNE